MGLGKIHRTDRNSKADRIIQDQQNMQILTGSTGQMGGKTRSTGQLGLYRSKGMDGILQDGPIWDKQD
jgi:hypothetical protein